MAHGGTQSNASGGEPGTLLETNHPDRKILCPSADESWATRCEDMDLITLDPRVFDGKDGIGSGRDLGARHDANSRSRCH